MISVREYMSRLKDVIDQVDEESVGRAIDLLWTCYLQGGRLVICGNGGSSATASHIVADLQKNMFMAARRKQWEVIALTDSVPLITAWSNDTDYANVFAGQANCWLRPKDVLLTISGSGNSPNVLAATEVAKEIGAVSIALCGYGGGKLAKQSDMSIVLESCDMQLVEDVHVAILHSVYKELLARALAWSG